MQFQSFFLIIQVMLAISLISLILLQHGKGAQAGAAFGSGASATVFGSRGSTSFLTRITTILAIVFFANSLGLAYLSAMPTEPKSLIDQVMIQTDEPATVGAEMVPADLPVNDQAVAADSVTDVIGAIEAPKPADVPPVE